MGSRPQHQHVDTTTTTPPRTPLGPGRGRGTIQHLYPERSFGFIRCTEGAPDDVGQDFFFHLTGLDAGVSLSDLLPGRRVEFECREVPKGKRAERIALAD